MVNSGANYRQCLSLLVGLHLLSQGKGFVPILHRNSIASATPTSVSHLQSSESDTVEEAELANSEQAGKKGTLVFHADIDMLSDPLPEGTSKEEVTTFLRRTESRDMLLSAGGTRPVHEVPMTDELAELWKECCKDYGSEYLPESEDCILACDATIQFPGVKLVTTTYSGVKRAKSETEESQYTFLMVGEEQSASGLLTGIFNRLTGNDKKGDSLEPSGRATSVISVVENQDKSLAFNFDASIEIKVEFPSFLLKILPVSKEKAEAQGSASISKTISKDIKKAVNGAYEAFTQQ
jgi:hypothetical protein